MIVKLVRLDSNADNLPCIDVHAFCGLGIEHIMDRWFSFPVCGRREPEVRSFVWVAGTEGGGGAYNSVRSRGDCRKEMKSKGGRTRRTVREGRLMGCTHHRRTRPKLWKTKDEVR